MRKPSQRTKVNTEALFGVPSYVINYMTFPEECLVSPLSWHERVISEKRKLNAINHSPKLPAELS